MQAARRATGNNARLQGVQAALKTAFSNEKLQEMHVYNTGHNGQQQEAVGDAGSTRDNRQQQEAAGMQAALAAASNNETQQEVRCGQHERQQTTT